VWHAEFAEFWVNSNLPPPAEAGCQANSVTNANFVFIATRTENNRVVNFPGNERLIGEYVDVTITAAVAHTLRGEIVAVE
jgi:tRNA A37 methylthiotransferase MiaB